MSNLNAAPSTPERGIVSVRDGRPRSSFAPLLDIDWGIRPYETVLLSFAGICAVLQSGTPLPYSPKLAAVFVMKLCQLVLVAYALAAAITIVRFGLRGRRDGWSALCDRGVCIELLQPYFTLDFLMRSIRRTFAIFATIYFFLHLKHVILFLRPANYDLAFWNFDRWLHFGVQPNVWAMETFGSHHDIALFTDWMYVKYFDYKMLVCFLFLLEPVGRKLSEQFFLAYALVWSLGGLGYLAFPADGPCYAMLVNESTLKDETGNNPHIFRFPVETKLSQKYVETFREAKIWNAKSYQEILWEHRQRFIINGRLPGYFYGIAAMPSLHVAAVTILALFLFQVGPILGVLGVLYALVTFFGSIFLQWHYAVDGYVGALIALTVFWVSGRWINRPARKRMLE